MARAGSGGFVVATANNGVELLRRTFEPAPAGTRVTFEPDLKRQGIVDTWPEWTESGTMMLSIRADAVS